MITRLPNTSLVPFRAKKVIGSQVLWQNEQLATITPEDYSYAIPFEFDQPEKYSSKEKIFLAERYGGRGMAANGGGARCGLDGVVQIKGIGANPLVGKSDNYWYSHGGATLEECIREAIWGEVCAVALPYGGVRSYAVLAMPTTSPFDGANGKEYVVRGLLLRQAALRPAHYMRAIYYLPSDEMLQNYPSDVERTRAAIQTIDKGLESVLGYSPDQPLDASYINAGLLEMTRRFAWQIAAARAKKIMHGAVGCANIALDGRWLDYGTMMTLSDYGRYIAGRDQLDFWEEHRFYLYTIENLPYYLRRYLPTKASAGLISNQEMVAHFIRCLRERLSVEFLKLTGLPERFIVKTDTSITRPLYLAMMEVVFHGNKEPFSYCDTEKTGAFHLNTILRLLCASDEPADAERKLESYLDFVALRQRLITAYFNFKSACLALAREEGIPAVGLAQYAARDAYRRNRVVASLYRWKVVLQIQAALADGVGASAISKMIDTLRADAMLYLGEPGVDGALIKINHQTGEKTYIREDGCYFTKAVNGVFQSVQEKQVQIEQDKDHVWKGANSFWTEKTSALRVNGTPADAVRKKHEQLGYAALLVAQSRNHAGRIADHLRRVVEPAINRGKARFYFNVDGQAVGYVFWATLSEEVEQRVRSTGMFNLHESEWDEGNSAWIIDVCAPRGNLKYILQDLRDSLFKQYDRVSYRRFHNGKFSIREVTRNPKLTFFSRSDRHLKTTG